MIGLLLAAFMAAACQAQPAAEALEYRIKAAFVCKFANYVEWPATAFDRPDSPVVMGIFAKEAVFDELARTANGLSVDGRPLIVRRMQPGAPVADLHLVYITRSEEEHLADTLAATKGKSVLVVTESRQAAPLGGMINFVVVDDKVRFDIAPQAAEQSRLRISARLLGVARSLLGKAP